MNILKSLLLFFLINTPYVAAQEVTIVNNSGERVILIAPDDSPSYLKYFSAKCQRIFFENKKNEHELQGRDVSETDQILKKFADYKL